MLFATPSLWARSDEAQRLREPAPEGRQDEQDETVMFNTQSGKYHCPQCEWAVKCTKNCVPMSLRKVRELGGVPCKVCGGRCR